MNGEQPSAFDAMVGVGERERAESELDAVRAKILQLRARLNRLEKEAKDSSPGVKARLFAEMRKNVPKEKWIPLASWIAGLKPKDLRDLFSKKKEHPD